MFKSLTRSGLLGIFLSLALLTTFNAYADDDDAEPMAFSYTFEGNRIFLCDGGENDGLSCTINDHCPLGQCDVQLPWAPGAVLTGEIDGTIDPLHPDRVFIKSFRQVHLSRTGLPVFAYDTIDASEFISFTPGGTPVMSFSGTILDFGSCPGGFTDDTDDDGVLDDCPYGLAPGGGFLMLIETTDDIPPEEVNFTTAADGTGASVCPDDRRLHGCRVVDAPIVRGNWSLIRLDLDDDCTATGKTQICHIPPGNPNKSHTECVAFSAVNAHLDHGDALGACL